MRSIYARYCCRRLSVCPSVCLSVKRVYSDKTKAPSEKSSIMTNRNRPRAFQWASDKHRTLPLTPKGASKAIFFHFSGYKIRLFSKKVCYKVSLCENFQRHSCKSFTGLCIRAQMVGGGRPLRPEILGQSDPPSRLQKRRLPIDIRPYSDCIVRKRDDYV